MKKIIMLVVFLIAGFSQAATVKLPLSFSNDGWIRQPGVFVTKEEISQRVGWEADYARIVTEEGFVWKVDIDLPLGNCVVIRETYNDHIHENDRIILVCPVK